MGSENYPWTGGGFNRALDEHGENVKREVRVAMPGRIVSFDPASITATVQLMIDQQLADGSRDAYPELGVVPVYTLRGGNYICTMPIAPGDPCLVIFGDRCIDSWQQSESQDMPADYRLHDLSDGFALVGPTPLPRAVPGYNAQSAALRSVDGQQRVQLDPDGTITQANAAGSTVLNGAGQFVINAPAGIVLNGNTHLIGDLSSQAGNGGAGNATMANIMRALDVATAHVASHDTHFHDDPQGGSVSPPRN
ncbi:Gp138 family membrane-puncturing spike protein [Paraburkholderia sp. BR10923]